VARNSLTQMQLRGYTPWGTLAVLLPLKSIAFQLAHKLPQHSLHQMVPFMGAELERRGPVCSL
jgi:hypothetical protein